MASSGSAPSSGAPKSDSSSVRVIVRIRPLLPHEVNAAAAASAASPAAAPCVQVTRNGDLPAVLVKDTQVDSFGKETSGETLLSFDAVYDSATSQETLFQQEVLPHVQARVFAGSTATIFAFGMTGTGKSHSMNGTSSQPGLIPRTIQHLFDTIQDRVACQEQDWATTSVSFSYFELYNEKVYDLLKPAALVASKPTDRGASDHASSKDQPGDLPVREDANGKVFVANLSETKIESYAAFASAYAQGMKNRKIASTKYNSQSSRAHTMIQVKVEYRTKSTSAGTPAAAAGASKKVIGRIQLLDLAGNEDNRFSGNTASKSRMVESSKINNSLFVLGKVINSLNAGESRIAYRDSKLTRLLQDSLGGSNYAIILSCISPNPAHLVWTQRTLNFAQKGRMVVNCVEKNVTEQPAAASSIIPMIRGDMSEERKAELKAKLDAWKTEKGRLAPMSAAQFAAASNPLTQAAKAKRVEAARTAAAATAAAASSATTHSSTSSAALQQPQPIIQIHQDPAMLKKISSLENDVSTMKAEMRQQQRAHALQLKARPVAVQQPPSSFHHRPTSAPAAASHLSGTTAGHQSMSSVVPLTPISSAALARTSVEKAKVYERIGAWSAALAEYLEAQRIRPGNEKLRRKIEQIEGKMRRGDPPPAQSAAANTSSTTSGKHAREVSAPAVGPQAKQRKLSAGLTAVGKAIPEEDEEEEEEEGSEDEEDATESEGEQSDYAPSSEDDDEDAGWMRRAKSTRSRSNPSSQEVSPTTSPTLAVKSASAITPPAGAKTSATAAVKRPNTSPNTAATTTLPSSKPASVRTPLSTIQSQPQATSTVSPAGGALTKSKPPPATKSPLAKITAAITNITAAIANKENAPTPTTTTTAVAKKVSLLKAAPPVVLGPVVPPSVVPVVLPVVGPGGLLLSNLVSGRDNLLRLLNHGTLKELMGLQTIGKKRAQLILSKREEVGAYVTLADLAHIGLSETQVEQFTQRNLMSTVWNAAQPQMTD